MEDKIITGVSTSDEFLKAINDKGAELTNESTPYELVDAINKTGGMIDFESTNKEVIDAVNAEVPVEKVTLTIDGNGGTIGGESTEVTEVDDGSTFTKATWESTAVLVAPAGKEYDDLTTTKDDDTTKIGATLTIDDDTTLYILWKDEQQSGDN